MNRKVVIYLLGFYAFFTLYNTLIPFSFDFGIADLPEQLRLANWKLYFGGVHVSLTDIVGNIILFIPGGFLLFMLMHYQGVKHPVASAVFLSALLSLTIEILQLFMASRNTAVHDLFNNTLGGGIGALTALIYSNKISAVGRKIFYELLDRKPFLLIPVIIALVQLVAAVMPLTVSISVSSLMQSVKETNLAPFDYQPISVVFLGQPHPLLEFQVTEGTIFNLRAAGMPQDDLQELAALINKEPFRQKRFLKELKSVLGRKRRDNFRKELLAFSQVKEQQYFKFSDMLENLLFWLVIGYVFRLCYRIYWRKKRIGKLILYGVPLVYFVLLESCQLVITSRISDINDVISGYGGMLLGFAVYKLLRPIRRKDFKTHLDLLKIPLIFYGIFILFAGLQPFDWSLDPQVVAKDLIAENLVPFFAYFRKTNLWNIYDLINSLTFFLPISFFWAYRLREKEAGYSGILWKTVLAGLALGGFIEFTQLLSVTRTAEITDVLAYGGGGAIGTFLVYYYHQQIVPTLTLYRKGEIVLGA